MVYFIQPLILVYCNFTMIILLIEIGERPFNRKPLLDLTITIQHMSIISDSSELNSIQQTQHYCRAGFKTEIENCTF